MKRRQAIAKPAQDQREGAVLLVAMGILTLLAVFAITFANLVSIEKTASRNYVDAVRAKMVARAGLERAIAELKSHAQENPFDDPRAVNDGGNPWIFRDRYLPNPRGMRRSAAISFSVQDPDHQIVPENNADGAAENFYYSGNMGATYTDGLDCYKLKILDCASMVHVNGADTRATERMMTNLLRAHFGTGTPGGTLSAANCAAIAARVEQMRPGGGYRTKAEVGLVMRSNTPALTEAQWNIVQNDITCFAWLDTKVIQPPLARSASSTTTTTSTSLVNDTSSPRRLELTERAPLNMNTASREALTAIFAELEAVIVETERNYNGATVVRNQDVQTVSLGFNLAYELAEYIVARRDPSLPIAYFKSGASSSLNGLRSSANSYSGSFGFGPFRSWYEFETWLDNLTSWGANSRQRDLVRAMANPNTDIVLRKWGLEGNHIFRWRLTSASSGRTFVPSEPREIDKTDLTKITTELCFSSMGYFEITSLGQVWDRGETPGSGTTTTGGALVLKRPVAEQTVQSVVQVFNILRLTSQAEFEADREHNDPKLYLEYQANIGSVEGFTTLASESGAWPATLTQPEYSNKHQLPTTGASGSGISNGSQSATLDTGYKPADYDGQIILNGLARIPATSPDFLVGFARGALGPLKTRFYQNDKGVGITESDAVQNFSDGTAPRLTNDEPARSLLNPGGSFATLFNGAGLTNLGPLITADRDRYLVYDGNNIDLRSGTVHFWVKPVRDVFKIDAGAVVEDDYEEKEVFCSFFGGFTPTGDRDAGFEIYKDVELGQIYIVARFFGLNGARKGAPISEIRFPVGTIDNALSANASLNPGSLWREGAWNHIQLSFGIDQVGGLAYNATLIVNSQFVEGGAVDVASIGVRHAFAGPAFNGSSFVVYPASSTRSRGQQWRVPYNLFDYYYCHFDPTSYSVVQRTGTPVFRDPSEDGQYRPGTTPPITFPEGAFDEEIIVEFEPSSFTPSEATPPSPGQATPPRFGENYDPSVYPANSETPPGEGEWYYGPTQDVRDNKWRLKFTPKWREAVTSSSTICTDCVNCQDCSNAHTGTPDQYDPPVKINKDEHCWNEFNVHSGRNTLNECDDCKGCEACDIDGPVYIGAERYFANGNEANPLQDATAGQNPTSFDEGVIHFCNAIIDNLYFLGYRVDGRGEVETRIVGAVNVPSDRFFDSDVTAVNSGTAGARGHKPGYKRLLTELYGRRLELGTVTWTGYPGFNRRSVTKAEMEQLKSAVVSSSTGDVSSINPGSSGAGALVVKNVGAGQVFQTFRNLLSPDSLLPVTVTIQRWDFSLPGSTAIDYVAPPSNQGNFLAGICSSRPFFDSPALNSYSPFQDNNSGAYANEGNFRDPDHGGRGIAPLASDRLIRPSQLLILSVDFAPAITSSAGTYQTPVFDDVTISYFTSPKVIYTEEGVEE